jgi:hypothetical protein
MTPMIYILVSSHERHTADQTQPDQVNPPVDAQLPPVLPESEDVLLKDATMESSRCVFPLSHFGQICAWLASEKRTINSKTSPQSLH